MKRKMKSSRIWKIGVVLAMLLSVFTLTRQEVKADTPANDFIFGLDSGFIVGYNGSDTDIVIPSVIYGITVKGIYQTAFTNNTTVKSVTIPSTVTTIGSGDAYTGAFFGCTALEIVTIQGNVPNIGKYAFYNCTSLKTIDNTTPITSLKENAFFGCAKLSNINLGELSYIDHRAFAGCTSLPKEKIIFADSLMSIGMSAFKDCRQLTEITLPNSLTTIGSSAFESCSLPYITLPDSVERVGDNAFADQKSTGVYTVKNGISTYTFPTAIDVSKVTTAMTGVTIDASKRTATSSNALTTFIYTYTATYIASSGTTINVPVNVTVTMSELILVDAVTPTITNDLSTSEVKVVKDAMASPLNATATVSDGGDVTYQWYRSTTNNADDGTIIDGATNATYTPTTDTVGTTYYYCVVTNTNNSATGNKTATTTSKVAMITVTKKAPTMIEGQDQAAYKGEEEELLFVSSADFVDFMEVQVDNQKIAPSYYKAEAGSIRITLKPEYLKTLAVGEHVLSIVATSGDVDATFVIKARDTKPQDPIIKPDQPNKPGDTGNAGNTGNTGNTSNPTTPTPTETKKEVTNTSDTTTSMTGLFSMIVLAGATMLGLRKKENFK